MPTKFVSRYLNQMKTAGERLCHVLNMRPDWPQSVWLPRRQWARRRTRRLRVRLIAAGPTQPATPGLTSGLPRVLARYA
jgi:hypothetical protein